MNIDDAIPFASLIDSDAFRDVCKSYTDLFGTGIKIFSAEGEKIVDIRANNGDHCGLLYSVQPTRGMCTQLVSHIKSVPLTEDPTPVTIDCFSGLRYKIMPVVHDGDLVARVIFGPYAPAIYDGPPEALKSQSPELDFGRLKQYGNVIPRLHDGVPEKILDHLRQVLDVLIHSSYKAAITSRLHIASISGAFSDLERNHADLRDLKERLQDLHQLKRNFVSTVSHELRTPLTSVIGYSEMLLEGLAGDLNDEQRSYISTILQKGERLLLMINQILDLSRAEAKESHMRREPTEMRRLLLQCLKDVETQSVQRNIQFETEVDETVTPILVDPDKIRSVINNLLSNAIKFTPTGGTVGLRLDVVTEPPPGAVHLDPFIPEHNKYLRIRVSDTGIGIAKDKLDRIFEAFYQVDNSETREFGGTGMGLSVVRSFTQAHRGRVDVQSEEGRGSTFSVRLPYVVDLLPPGAVQIDGLQARKSQ